MLFPILLRYGTIVKVIFMKIAGIISEYDPLHAGHIYHMEETRRRTGCDYLVVVMDGWMSQRGEISFMDKFLRVRMALTA